ncbi:MAG TPA: DNA mismatch repair protein MutS [Thermoanaerobaculia bacterium]|jgi:DNA mismatch repair protein MutS|nr:DNA mismatch repair protein MutS [Thermoanaerobaculia bacterium]
MKLTPMLEQYFEIKRQVPDAILFYRLGDFYEMFFEDAEKAAPLLDLVLTARNKGQEYETPMCGVPYHSADGYIAKLIRHGLRVAICDQTEEAGQGKGLVRREIVRVVTPGTATESSIVERESCYLVSLVPAGETVGAAYLDVSTGDFFVTAYGSLSDGRLYDDMARFAPREAIVPRETETNGALTIPITPVEPSLFELRGSHDYLIKHFGTQSLRGFGLEDDDARIGAAGGALRYASASHKRSLEHVRALRVDNDSDYLQLDAATLANLEVCESRDAARPRATLWSVVNATRTSMGTRTLRRWLTRPLKSASAIFDRHDAVDELTRSRAILEQMSARLQKICDLERVTSRITLRTATPRECLALAESLLAVEELRDAMAPLQGPLLAHLRVILRRNDGAGSPADGASVVQPQEIPRGARDDTRDVVNLIVRTLHPEPSLLVRDGGVIADGVDKDLDELRSIARDSKTILLQIEAREKERTGIGSLKIRFNSVFGYYIEVSKSNLAKVPNDYIRKQTLANAERYITPDLKELEEKIVGAEEKAIAIELRLYDALLAAISAVSGTILETARAVGDIDALSSLATIAVRNRYVRPQLSEEAELCIEEGRHPVIEQLAAERFIPNHTVVRREDNGIQIITGPNMGGKSTYLRQVALIVLLNQAGSFVPAAKARLGVFDRIFTRVGASDQLARGESTFMVEMHETANILNNATDRSLIILDEVGRGTATFDGLSLAWAIIEYLHDNPARSGITLFATHYHEVTDLAKTKQRVANFNVAVKEWNEQIIFLRKVVAGAADKSYGIQVAKLAGIPHSVIERAREILETLERKERDVVEETRKRGPQTRQLGLFSSREQGVVDSLREVDLDTLSPREALNVLYELKQKLVE